MLKGPTFDGDKTISFVISYFWAFVIFCFNERNVCSHSPGTYETDEIFGIDVDDCVNCVYKRTQSKLNRGPEKKKLKKKKGDRDDRAVTCIYFQLPSPCQSMRDEM